MFPCIELFPLFFMAETANLWVKGLNFGNVFAGLMMVAMARGTADLIFAHRAQFVI